MSLKRFLWVRNALKQDHKRSLIEVHNWLIFSLSSSPPMIAGRKKNTDRRVPEEKLTDENIFTERRMRNVHEQSEKLFEFRLLSERTTEIDMKNFSFVRHHDVIVCREENEISSARNVRGRPHRADRPVAGRCPKRRSRETFERDWSCVRAILPQISSRRL